MAINKRLIGSNYELIAAEFLQSNGIIILDKNFRIKKGEIDIIGSDGQYLIFFEVKYRQDNNFAFAENAVGYKKQKIISKVSDYYRFIKGYSDDTAIRYDVLAINGEKINWYKNAFEYIN